MWPTNAIMSPRGDRTPASQDRLLHISHLKQISSTTHPGYKQFLAIWLCLYGHIAETLTLQPWPLWEFLYAQSEGALEGPADMYCCDVTLTTNQNDPKPHQDYPTILCIMKAILYWEVCRVHGVHISKWYTQGPHMALEPCPALERCASDWI